MCVLLAAVPVITGNGQTQLQRTWLKVQGVVEASAGQRAQLAHQSHSGTAIHRQWRWQLLRLWDKSTGSEWEGRGTWTRPGYWLLRRRWLNIFWNYNNCTSGFTAIRFSLTGDFLSNCSHFLSPSCVLPSSLSSLGGSNGCGRYTNKQHYHQSDLASSRQRDSQRALAGIQGTDAVSPLVWPNVLSLCSHE